MAEKLLILDDEPDMLKLLSMIIREKTPYEPVTTNNPHEAVELAQKGGFVLVITDLKMPGLDGIEVLTAIRRTNEDIPVIFITSRTDAEAQAKSFGAVAYFAKPLRMESLLAAVAKHLPA